MGSLYFLLNFLPPLSLDRLAEISLDEVMFYTQLNLSAREMQAVNVLHMYYDIENTISHLSGIPMRSIGSLPHEILREKIEDEELDLPGVQRFFSLYPTREKQKEHVHTVYRYFFNELPKTLPKFVRTYFLFEHTSRLLLAWLRAKDLSLPLTLNTNKIHFDIDKSWPEPYTNLFQLWKNRGLSARKIEEALMQWRFDAIASFCELSPPFSLDFILAYLIRLRIVEAKEELSDPAHIHALERTRTER